MNFVEWLRDHNAGRGGEDGHVGFYGLDLYSLQASAEAIIRYLDQIDPAAARRARERYACFEHFGGEMQAYGYATAVGTAEACEDQVVEQLLELQERAADLAGRDGRVPPDAHFFAQQNARLVQNAERYYRSMFRGRASSWNLRDEHMAETLDALRRHLGAQGKVVVWAHNSHIGDARVTEMSDRGELNLGQLARERYGSGTRLVGFTTYDGTVTAASDWDAPAERKRVRPGLPGSWEDALHSTGLERLLLPLDDDPWDHDRSPISLLERAIGVIYRPETERLSHYVSHETACLLNAGDRQADVEITVYFSDRDPAGPYHVSVPPRRTLHVKFNDLQDPEPIPAGKDLASVITSSAPIVVQHTRLDSRQPENALLSTVAFAGT